LNFKNGDIFKGAVKNKLELPAYSEHYKADYAPKIGEYKYITGEVSTHTFEYSNYYGRFYVEGGKTVFTDGSFGKDDWIEQYELSSNEIDEIYKNSKSPTEIHNKGKSISKQKQGILQDEKRVEDEKKQKLLQKNEVIQNNLISKYGVYWGNLIYKKEFILGVTKGMVIELNYDEFYKISKVIRNKVLIDIWEFDTQKTLKNGSKEDGKALLALSLLYEMQGLNIKSEFPKLVFTNGKIKDISKLEF